MEAQKHESELGLKLTCLCRLRCKILIAQAMI